MRQYIHRILFKLGFCKKEAKIILEAVIYDVSYFYMCYRICNVLCLKSHLGLRYTSSNAHYMSAYGFTFENYKKFIEENYPSLVKYLGKKEDYGSPWLGVYSRIEEKDRHLAVESKGEFLKYLVNKLN